MGLKVLVAVAGAALVVLTGCSLASSRRIASTTTTGTASTTCPPVQDWAPDSVSGLFDAALPCNISGVAFVGHDPVRDPTGPAATCVIYLAPLDVHTRAVAEAVIASNSTITSRCSTFSFEVGKQPRFKADRQRARLAARPPCIYPTGQASRRITYWIEVDGSVAQSQAPSTDCLPG